MCAAVIWRINPKQCKYEALDPLGDTFSSRANTKFIDHGVGIGTWLFAIGSGKARHRGLLGVWEIVQRPTRSVATQTQVASFMPGHKAKRIPQQWRMFARLVYDTRATHGNNLAILRNTSMANLLTRVPPSILNVDELEELIDAYGL
jgi:hypothetical protein